MVILVSIGLIILGFVFVFICADRTCLDKPSAMFMVLAILFLVIGACCLGGYIDFKEQEHSEAVWNNGVCTSCGGEMDLFSTAGTKTTVHFTYKCKKCGHAVTFSGEMK